MPVHECDEHMSCTTSESCLPQHSMHREFVQSCLWEWIAAGKQRRPIVVLATAGARLLKTHPININDGKVAGQANAP